MTSQQLLIWDSEVISEGPGRARVVARKPLSEMSVKQTARLLGVSEWTVNDLCRLGILKSWKPGSRRTRSDGKPSNAKRRIDTESVLSYKARSRRDGGSAE